MQLGDLLRAPGAWCRAWYLDLVDRGAEPSKASVSFVDFIKLGMPALLACFTATTDVAARLLASIVDAAAVMQAILPVAVALFSLHVIRAKKAEAVPARPARVGGSHNVYVYATTVRRVAKWLSPALVATAVYSTWSAIPNGVFGPKTIAGHILCASGAPARNAEITVVDARGVVTSSRLEITDDNGFFMADLRPWGRRPRSIKVRSGHQEQVRELADGEKRIGSEVDLTWFVECGAGADR